MRKADSVAFLSSKGNFTYFSVGDTTIRFRTSDKLKKYTKVLNWDNGYLVVMADYETLGLTEEYVDITNVLNELYFKTNDFLKPIKKVEIRYE